MSEENILVTEEVAENVEQTTEETPAPKMYTQEEVNDIVGKAKARARARIEKDYQRKYGNLEETLKTGTGKESVEEINDTLVNFYESKGVKIRKNPEYSAKDIEVLAKAEADDYIRGGIEDVVEEVDRLANIGAEKMTPREKALFKILAEHRKHTEETSELSAIGVTEDVYNSKEFKDFAALFKSDTPITVIYDNYAKTLPKKEIKNAGSMKSVETVDTGLKDFYTYEEAMKFTKEDFDKNPKLYEKVQESMRKW